MIKNTILQILLFSFTILSYAQTDDRMNSVIEETIDSWHHAASEANFENYKNLMTENAVFIGTDPTEFWKGETFLNFAKPYFDKGKAWSFTKLERHIFVDINHEVAWFDELLDTQMGICRGSGILLKVKNQWKINHYVLSITIPNENVKEVKALKERFDQKMIEKLSSK